MFGPAEVSEAETRLSHMPAQSSSFDRGRIDVYRCEDLYSRMCERANPPAGPVLTELVGSQVLLPAERKFGSIADTTAYVKALHWSTHAQLWPRSVPELLVRARAGDTRAHWEHPRTIAIPETSELLREHVVLHEVAHHLDHHTRSVPAPAHGPIFRSILIQLHTVATGDVGGWALAVLFDLHLTRDTTT
jgi:putative metallohydrolase (TIGR04338 family)